MNMEKSVNGDMASRPKFLTEAECKALADRVHQLTTGGGETQLQITSQWRANTRYARNRVIVSGDTRSVRVTINRGIRGAWGSCVVNQIDDKSLKAAIEHAEKISTYRQEPLTYLPVAFNDEPHLKPNIWSESTFNLEATSRVSAINDLMSMASSAGLMSAGYAQIAANGIAIMQAAGEWRYYPHTTAQYSVTVRDAKGTASGWAGVDWNDWSRINTKQLCQIALDKCLQSRNPMRIEPGRYTTILEPQAVCDLFYSVVHPFPRNIDRAAAETGGKPFSGVKSGTSKIGLSVLDRRINVSADPMDPDCGFVPFTEAGIPYRAVNWIESGVLKELAYSRQYAVENFRSKQALPNSGALRISSTENTSVEDMIKTTRRGLLITRFHEVAMINEQSMLCSGFTRDGVWLIENGKVSMPVKNLRFTDSPLLAFNNIEQIGVPQRVFHPGAPVTVPAVKIKDFNFTSMSDAV